MAVEIRPAPWVAAASVVPVALALAVLAFGAGWTAPALAAAAAATLFAWRCLGPRGPRPAGAEPPPAGQPQGGLCPTPPDNFVARIASGVETAVAELCRQPSPLPREAIERELDKHLGWFLRHRRLYSRTHESRDVTVIISDLRGFASISEYYSAAEVVDLLNRYFAHMGQAISKYKGVVDKYMGDSIMVLFGVPEKSPDDILNAVSCAAEMQIAMGAFNRENELMGMPQLYMGIGINTGEVIAGRLGNDLHSEYTVIGDQVNLASRIEAASLRGQVLMSESTYAQVKDFVTVRDPIHVSVKGRRAEVRLYDLTSVRGATDLVVPDREVRKSVRADVNIPFRFQLCEGKIVLHEGHEGRILNISAGGMLFCTLAAVEPQQTVRFRIGYNVIGRESADIYGKVLRVRPNGSVFDANVEFTFIDPEDGRAIGALVHNTLSASPQGR